MATFHDVFVPLHSRLCPRAVHPAHGDVSADPALPVISMRRLPAVVSRPRSLAVTVEPAIDVTPAPYVPYVPYVPLTARVSDHGIYGRRRR